MCYYSHVLHCWHGDQWQNNSSSQHKTMSVTQFHLLWSCMMYTSVKKSSTSVRLKLCNSQTLWWVFYQTKKSSRLNTLHRTSAQQWCVSYTALHGVTSSASKSLWTSRRLLKSDFVTRQRRNMSFYLGIHLWPEIKTCCSQQVVFLLFLNIKIQYGSGSMRLLSALKKIFKMKLHIWRRKIWILKQTRI